MSKHRRQQKKRSRNNEAWLSFIKHNERRELAGMNALSFSHFNYLNKLNSD